MPLRPGRKSLLPGLFTYRILLWLQELKAGTGCYFLMFFWILPDFTHYGTECKETFFRAIGARFYLQWRKNPWKFRKLNIV